MNKAVELLRGDITLAVVNGDRRATFVDRGIKALLSVLSGDDILKGADVADKVVGKAAALLFVKGGVKRIYAEVCSKPARDVLVKYGVELEYKTLTGGIVNRAGDGPCPMEYAVLETDDPDEAAKILSAKLEAMNK